nr:response regulator transcription factor [uncultured Blautia sp.]
MKQILLLEDDEGLNRGISLKLKKEGYVVFSAFTIKEARWFLERESIDLLISDVSLPDGNGMEFCREARAKSELYIIFLSALDQEVDIVNGYDCGADDYMIKPFSLLVLISKVNAFMRRAVKQEGQILVSKDIRVHCNTMQVYEKDEPVMLSKKELQLLIYLMENAGRIVTKEQILEHVWDMEGQFVEENTVTVNISRLKNKLQTNAIGNVRGLGYLWTEKVRKE